MQRIVPCISFNDQAEQAVRFYTSLFEDSQIEQVLRYTHVGQEIHQHHSGSVMSIGFKIADYRMLAVNGGPKIKLNPSISLAVTLNSTNEINDLWHRLIDGGRTLMPLNRYPFNERYGWLTDKFGLSWQISLDPPDPVTHQIIAPSLLFSGHLHGSAETALKDLVKLFPNSRIATTDHYENKPRSYEYTAPGTLIERKAYLDNECIKAINTPLNHNFTFNEAFSLQILCNNQTDIAHYWHALTADPTAEHAGWLKDRHGISWQVVPRILSELLADPDLKKNRAVLQQVLSMKKLDIAPIIEAYERAGTISHPPHHPDIYI